MKSVSYCFLHGALVKNLMKKLPFLIQIFKGHIKIYYIGDFQDLKLAVTKMMAVSIKCQISNEHFLYYRFNEVFVKKFMKKLSLFNIKFQNPFQYLVFSQVFRSQTFCY